MDDFRFGAQYEEENTTSQTESLKTEVKELEPELNRVQSLTLKSGDVSFDVRNSDAMRLSASASVSITTIMNGYNGQLLSLIFNDSNIMLVHDATGAKGTLNMGGANFTSANGNVINLISDGTSWLLVKTVLSNSQTFLASGTWTKPNFGTTAIIQCWGSGGGGGSGNNGGGGGGGAYVERQVALSSLGATETVTIGNGGASVSGADGNGGGNASFGSHVVAYGGGGGAADVGNPGGGGGGGQNSAGQSVTGTTGGTGGNPFGGAANGTSIFGGGGGGDAGGAGGESVFGGGGGGSNAGVGGNSTHGGAGGGGSNNTAVAGGTSLYGGNGGAGGDNSPLPTDGSVPGGGGGGAAGSVASGAGGKGRIIVAVF